MSRTSISQSFDIKNLTCYYTTFLTKDDKIKLSVAYLYKLR